MATCVALIATAGCVELSREEYMKPDVPATPGVTVSPSHLYTGRGGPNSPAGPAQLGGVAVHVGGATVDVLFWNTRSGPSFIGPLLPVIPQRRSPEQNGPVAFLGLTVTIIASSAAIDFDPSAVTIRLPNGTTLRPDCQVVRRDPNRTSLPCDIAPQSIAPGGRKVIVLPFDIAAYGEPRLQLEMRGLSSHGSPIVIPSIAWERHTKWVMGMARS